MIILAKAVIGKSTTMIPYLDGFGIKFQPFLLIHQEFLDILTLIALKLNHLSHLGIVDNGAIAR